MTISSQNENINQMKSISADLCAQLGPQVALNQSDGGFFMQNDSQNFQALAICESFGITDTMLSAPIGNSSKAVSKKNDFHSLCFSLGLGGVQQL